MSRELTPTDRWTFGGWRAPLKRERACVDGATIFAWLESRAKSDTSDEGSDVRRASDDALARALTDARLVSCVDSSHPLLNDPRRLYRLADHASSPRAYPGRPAAPLNARRRWRGARRDARVVAASLRERVLALYDAYLSSDGSRVDYAGMRASPAFDAYVDAAAELQTVDVHALTRAERVAFFLNVYNALVVHVTAVVGPRRASSTDSRISTDTLTTSAGTRTRATTSNTACYAATDRARRRWRRFSARRVCRVGRSGRRIRGRALACVPMDPRIHFALVCGARSCPPIRTYTAEGLDAQLAAAAEAFVTGDVEIGDDAATTRAVTVSKITGEWYAGGFRERRRRETSRARGVRPGERRRRKSHREGVGRGGGGRTARQTGDARIRLDAQRRRLIANERRETTRTVRAPLALVDSPTPYPYVTTP